MDLQQIKQVNYLENTVLLSRGVARMHELWRKDSQKKPDITYEQFVNDLVNNALYKIPPETTSQWRHQNSLKDFFVFLEHDLKLCNKKDSEVEIIKRAEKLLRLFDCLENIDNNCVDSEKHSSIPYDFERLCNIMNEIAGSEMCYLILFHDNNITPLSTSSFSVEILNYVLDKFDFHAIHNEWGRSREKRDAGSAPIADTIKWSKIWKKSSQESAYCLTPLLTLCLDVPKEANEKLYIVFQYYNDPHSGKNPEIKEIWDDRPDPLSSACEVDNTDLEKMRDLLSLRTKLVSVTIKCLNTLILSQTTCRYVRPLGDKNILNILHLTDLHIKTKDKDNLKRFIEQFPVFLPEKKQRYDLVVITGDVVQGQGSAGVLEEHYFIADELLRALAKRLWSEDDKVLRADWRKRLIIIPGNHDYAAMNELEVVHQKGLRSTGAGRPSRKEGGPMVKFAYFLHFVHRLLGIDIESQINNWLNSDQYYDQMKLRIICLNTNAGAGPLRNNKVHIDKDYPKKLKKAPSCEDYLTICLAHHTDNYKPDYAVDRYASAKTWEIVGDLVKKFRDILKLDPTKDQEEIQNKIDGLVAALLNEDLDAEDPLMADCTYYKDNFRDTEDERCESIRSAMMRDDKMQEEDKKKLTEVFKDLKKENGTEIILGGHVHEFKKSQSTHTYDGSLFYDTGRKEKKNMPFAFAVLCINQSKMKYSWIPYHCEVGKPPVEFSEHAAKNLSIP